MPSSCKLICTRASSEWINTANMLIHAKQQGLYSRSFTPGRASVCTKCPSLDISPSLKTSLGTNVSLTHEKLLLVDQIHSDASGCSHKEKKISCASGKLSKGLIAWVLQMLLGKLHVLPWKLDRLLLVRYSQSPYCSFCFPSQTL